MTAATAETPAIMDLGFMNAQNLETVPVGDYFIYSDCIYYKIGLKVTAMHMIPMPFASKDKDEALRAALKYSERQEFAVLKGRPLVMGI